MSDVIDTEVKPEAPPADDLRATLSRAFEEHEAAATPPEPKEKAAPVADAPKPEADAKPGERARGPDGKFVRTEAEQAADAAAKPSGAPAKPDAAPVETTPKADGKEPPANWSNADKATFAAQTPQAQDFLLRRHAAMEADYTRKVQQVAQLRQDYEPVAQMFAPYQADLQRNNLTPASLIQAWANVEMRLKNGDGVNVIRGLVDGYKIPVEQLASALGIRAPQTTAGADGQVPAPQPEGHPPQLPPEFVQRLAAIEQRQQQDYQRQQYMAQQEQHAAATRVMSDIEKFAAETDSSGALAHPHFQDVEAEMARLVLAYRASGQKEPALSELYDQAVWANPSTRTHQLDRERAAMEAQRTAAEEKRKVEARAKSEQSRRAGASISGSPGGPPQVPGRGRGNGSVRETLAAAFEDLET